MAFLEELMKGGVQGLTGGLGELAKDIRAAITGKSVLDATAAAEIEFKLAALEAAAQKAASDYDTAQMQGQIEINKIEAASPDRFTSGWRPAIGWVCVMALVYTYLAKPILPWVFQVGALMVDAKSVVPALPEVPMGDLLVLLGGMLGIGAMRSLEKIKGVSR